MFENQRAKASYLTSTLNNFHREKSIKAEAELPFHQQEQPQWSIMHYSHNVVQIPSQTQPDAQDFSLNTHMWAYYGERCLASLTPGPFFTCSCLHLYIFYIVPELFRAHESAAGLLLGQGKILTDCSICTWMITRIWWCFWVMYCKKSKTDTLCSTLLTT